MNRPPQEKTAPERPTHVSWPQEEHFESKKEKPKREFRRVIFSALLIAVLITAGVFLYNTFLQASQTSLVPIQIINYEGKAIPVSELIITTMPDCPSPHWHARTRVAIALDGSAVADPSDPCGFGKRTDRPVSTIFR